MPEYIYWRLVIARGKLDEERKKETKTSDNLSSSIVGRIIEKHLPKCNNKCISMKITVERFHRKQYNIYIFLLLKNTEAKNAFC